MLEYCTKKIEIYVGDVVVNRTEFPIIISEESMGIQTKEISWDEITNFMIPFKKCKKGIKIYSYLHGGKCFKQWKYSNEKLVIKATIKKTANEPTLQRILDYRNIDLAIEYLKERRIMLDKNEFQ